MKLREKSKWIGKEKVGPILDRRQYEQVRLQVDRILWEDWDPIGANDQPGAFGEYTTYAPGVIRLLIEGADVRRLSEHLADIEQK